MGNRLLLRVLLSSLLATATFAPDVAYADANAEARFYFERGNDQLARGMRSQGAARRRAMTTALADYLQSLRIVRSKNTVYNLAVCHEALGNLEESFDYFAEYLRTELNDAERAEATRRLDALRPRVAVVEVGSVPAGASVFVDRRDLAARGATPLSIAVPAGRHQVFVVLEGYAPREGELTAAVGRAARYAVELSPLPAAISIETGGDAAEVILDGRVAGRTPLRVSLAHGAHDVRLRRPGFEELRERVELHPGEDRVLRLTLSPLPEAGGLAVRANVPAAEVMVDGAPWGVASSSPRGIVPGRHTVVVSAPGYRPATVVANVLEGQAITVRARLSPEEPPRRYGPLPVVAGIAAGVSLAAGAVVGLSAMSRQDALDQAHGDYVGARDDYENNGASDLPALLVARQRSRDVAGDIDRLNTVADVLFVGAAVFAAVTGVLLVTSTTEDPGPSSARVASGAVGPSLAEAR